MFITEAIAATETTTAVQASPMAGFLIQLVLVFAIFYFLLIRPQQKKMKEHENMLNAIKPKDEIITGGGIYATVTKTSEEILTVEIAKGVEIKISRSSVREVVSDKKDVKK
ncbi:MAG: preprotein translocase subunit YajC [Alphaproteobacteria bacterium]|nr:preprotein translocase subunit YajC [Alphaproteobacteria bacterium]MBO5442028.1 preprotein translocase subunit YajC [Alphaproteobacteria bacterium]